MLLYLKWMQKQKRVWERPKKNWMEGTRKVMNERIIMKTSGKIGSDEV